MPQIPHPSECCTVIVTVDADPSVMPALEAHARAGIGRFVEFEGFIAGALHRSDDGSRIVQYLQWENEEAHLACVTDPCWDELPSAREFMGHVEAGRAALDVRVYDVVASGSRSKGA